MTRAARILGQAACYLALAAALAIFSQRPSYLHFAPGQALIKLSISHGGEHKGECRTRQFAGIKETQTTRRALRLCPRERHPVSVELSLDGKPVFSREQPPSGLSGDGPSYFYERITVAAGHHHLTVRMRDSGRGEGFDYEIEQDIDLHPAQVLAVVFSTQPAGFILR